MEELIRQVKNLNGVMGAPWLFEKIKKIYPNATFLEMGYEGGYSPRIVNNKLLNYDGTPYSGLVSMQGLTRDDYAFGTILIDSLGKDSNEEEIFYQVYHDGKGWSIETYEGDHISTKDARSIFVEITKLLLKQA